MTAVENASARHRPPSAGTVRLLVAWLVGLSAAALVAAVHIGPVRAGNLDVLHLLFGAGAALILGVLGADWMLRNGRAVWVRLRRGAR